MHAEIDDGEQSRDHRTELTFISFKTQATSRGSISYRLTARQQPKQSRMCGVGERFDRRPVDPPPVIQLELLSRDGSKCDESNLYESPWFFMCATLLPDDGSSDPPFQLETTFRSATGCMVSSLNHLKDLKDQNGAFFVFPDISIRVDGHYRFRMTLFEITENGVHCWDSIDTEPFIVFPAKKFPGMEESTSLSRLFAEQGLKIRIRKEVRTKRRNSKRRQLVEQTVARLEAEGSNSSPIPAQSVVKIPAMTGTSAQIIRPKAFVNDTNPPQSAITLPRNILDTHGRSAVPIKTPYMKGPPLLTTAIPDTFTPPRSNIFQESHTSPGTSRRSSSSEPHTFTVADRAHNHDRHPERHSYNRTPPNYSEYQFSPQPWKRHHPDQQ